ncbi:hypothetical protein SDC9_104641 [bioreactor metagenome]|uniref:Uncharacterized protein n=1 Tax=bioreactor metagenome TaxID=1076179 RepID=A0A645AYH5_9ZZZZ
MFKNIRRFLKRRNGLNTILELLGAIAIWWGIWGIMDLFVFPNNELWSYLISIILGFLIIFIVGGELDDLK